MGYLMIAKLVLAVVLIAVVAWFVHVALEHFREEGRAEIRKEDMPLTAQCDTLKQTKDACAKSWQEAITANATLAADVEKLRVATTQQNGAVDQWKDLATRSQATTAKLLAELAVKSKERVVYVSTLQNKAATPAANRGSECDEADAVSLDIATRRLHYFAGSTNTSKPSTDSNGAGAGSGSLHIGK